MQERKKERQKKRKKSVGGFYVTISCKNKYNQGFPQQCCSPLLAASSLHPLDAKAILKDLSENELTERGTVLWDG